MAIGKILTDTMHRAVPRLSFLFTARRYAIAVFAVIVCPSVCVTVCPSVRPSVTSRYCVETTGRIEPVLARRIPFTYLTLCFKKILVSPKIRVLPSETLSQTLDLENFSTVSRRRRRSSMFTTPIRQSASGGCLLQVDQL